MSELCPLFTYPVAMGFPDHSVAILAKLSFLSPCRGLLGSVAPQGHSSAKLDGEEFLSWALQKSIERCRSVSGLPRTGGKAGRRQAAYPHDAQFYVFQLDDWV